MLLECARRAPSRTGMSTYEPARSIRRTVTVAVVLACALTASQPGHGGADSGLFKLELDAHASQRLDNLEKGELRITWREDGPVLAMGELRTPGDSEREYEKGSAAPPIEGCFLLAPFEYTMKNRLGGGSRVVGRSWTDLVTVGPDTTSHALRFEFDDGPTHQQVELSLYDADPVGDTVYYLDGRQFEVFDLRVRGTGNGSVSATLVDAHGRRADVGDITLSDASIADEWRSVRLTAEVEGIHRHHLARLELRSHGSGTLEIDDISLCGADSVPRRMRPRREDTTNSLWVWHTSDLLAGGNTAVNELVDLAQRAAVSRIYLQVPSGFDEVDTWRALQAAAAQLAAAGISLFALDGAPEYALPSEHDDLLETVAEVIEYNDSVPIEARFVGMHLDVEPYLLDDWSAAREKVVDGYLSMLDAVRARTAEAGLALDVAVPFWFDSVPVHRPRGDRIERLSLTDEVLARVDSIAVMDYRTETDGSNGLLALGAGELAAAAEQDRDVWIGLETTWLPDQTFIRFRGEARAGLPEFAEQDWWVVATPDTLWAVRGDSLAELGDRLQNVDITEIRHWPAHAVEVPASRQTFYDLGFEALLDTMRETAAQLEGHPAFAGIALHYDRPLRRLLDAYRE